MSWWDQLSDAELEARLIQRDVDPHFAKALAEERDDNADARRAINEALD